MSRLHSDPRVVAGSNPGLELANACGVNNPGLELANACGVNNPGLALTDAFGVSVIFLATSIAETMTGVMPPPGCVQWPTKYKFFNIPFSAGRLSPS